jgi:ethanolamine utilization microcompartment shell protein EutL
VWRESLGVDSLSQILFKRNTISFDPSIIVASSGTYERPAVTATGNNVYVLWDGRTLESRDILYRRSTDGGASFGGIVNLSNTAAFSVSPVLAASGNNVYVVWIEDTAPGVRDILYRRSTDGGASFGGIVNLTENTASDAEETAIVASGNNVYVLWSNFPNVGNVDILYKKSTNGGASFGDTKNLSNSAGNSGRPTVAVSGNNVYVVWHDNTTQGGVAQFDILYRRSTNGGANFGSTVNLSNTAQASTTPSIAASNNLT